MKLIYITNGRIPTERAHGYQISKMCEEFGSLDIEVELWIPGRKNKIKKSIYELYGIKKNFLIKEIKSYDFLKFDKYIGRFSFWLHSLFFLVFLLFKKVDKDSIIYTRNVEVAFIFGLKKHRTVYEAHTWPESKTWLHNFLVKKLNKIVVISKGLKKLHLEEGFSEDKILVSPDGVDLEKFDIQVNKVKAREELKLPFDKKLAIYTGHLYEWKGTQTLADSAKLLDDSYRIVFVGGTDEDLVKFRKKNENKNIIIVGQVEHKQIPLYMKAADCLVLPNSSQENISRHYTSPLKMFEYMASKRPIVASDLPSIREILNRDNAILAKADDPKELAKKIKIALSDQELSNKISEQAFRDVSDFTWQKRASNILSFIKKFN